MSIETYSDKDELICPYCGHHHKIDYTEGFYELEFDELEFECPKCGEIYNLSRSVHFTYETFKIKQQ